MFCSSSVVVVVVVVVVVDVDGMRDITCFRLDSVGFGFLDVKIFFWMEAFCSFLLLRWDDVQLLVACCLVWAFPFIVCSSF